MLIAWVMACLALATASAQQKTDDKDKILVKPPAPAQEFERIGPTVREIEIEYVGPRSVSRDVILSNMRTSVGQPYSPAAVEEDVRNLYATGFFVNLRIYDEPLSDGVKVFVIVQPKATVKEIVVAGSKEISEKAVRKKITFKVGDALSEQKISADSQAIRDYYQEKGFRNAQVQYKIDVNEQLGRAVVTYTIVEGERRWLRDIVFINANSVSTEELIKAIKTKKKNWLSFINKSGRILDEQMSEDLKRIRDTYYNHGYIDMSIKDVSYENYEEDSLRLKITVFEGIQYQVGKVTIEGNTLFTLQELRAKMKMLEGQVYSPKALEADTKAIRDVYGEKGYIETKAEPQRLPNIESGKMDLVYKVSEGPQFFVEKIIIQGNNRTKDKVLRRELALAPGEVYDSVRADASKKRLENLGYFEKVDVSDQDTNIPGRKNMVVTVEEKRTGSVTFGAGFSTVDSLLGFVELQQGNFDIANWPSFTGAGQKFRSRIQYGLERRDFTMSVTEPWFLDQKLSLGGDIFYNEAKYLSDLYNQRRYGAAIRLSKALNEFWTIGLRYQFENYEIFNMSDSASSTIRQEAGVRSKSSVRGTLTYDTRDNVFLTRKGERVEFAAEGAGGPLMGDTKIWKLEAEGQKFFQLPYDLILSLNGATGVTDKYDGAARVPIFDRYFVGGSRSVRGFGYRQIGPLDETTEPIGGRTMAYSNVEVTYPIIDRVRGAVFFDSGIDNDGVFDYSFADIQAGVGMGLRLNLPIGPLRLDLGFPVIYNKNNDKVMKFHFDVGYQF